MDQSISLRPPTFLESSGRMFLLVLLLSFLSSCTTNLSPFTQEARTNYKLTPAELMAIQFYTSEEIVLRTGSMTKTKSAKDGELTLKTEDKVKEVIIPAGTPGKVVRVIDDNKIAVAFDETGKSLVFGNMGRTGRYTLMAMKWNAGRGKVKFGDEVYYSQAGSDNVFLSCSISSLKTKKTEKEVLGGSRVN